MASVVEAYERGSAPRFWASLSGTGLTLAERRAIALAIPHPEGRLLVVGCGTGREALPLARMGFRAVGIDLSRRLVEAAVASATSDGNPIYLVAEATRLPFADGTFDHVFLLSQMLGHIPGRELRRRALSEAARVARDDGVVLVSIYHRSFKDFSVPYLAWRAVRRRRGTGRSNRRPAESHAPSAGDDEVDGLMGRIRDVAGCMWRSRVLRAKLLARAAHFRLARAAGRPPLPESPRDLYVHSQAHEVSFVPRPGLAFYHLYTKNEFLDDARAAHLNVDQVHTIRELTVLGRFPPLFRDLDFLAFYALRRASPRTPPR